MDGNQCWREKLKNEVDYDINTNNCCCDYHFSSSVTSFQHANKFKSPFVISVGTNY